MSRTKAVLIIGGSGFVGTQLAQRLREKYKVFATYGTRMFKIPGVTFLPFQLGNRNWVKRLVYTAKPEVIIYTAGSNNAEWAEKNAREADRIHTGGPATVCAVSSILQPKFIYLSNCYTFDGQRGNYKESDTILPVTALGKAKIAGENFIKSKSLNYTIVRSSPVFGRGNGNTLSFMDHLRVHLDRGKRIEVMNNELHSFAPVDGLVDLLERLCDSGPRNKILHYGGLTKVTTLEFAQTFAKRFGYDPSLIIEKVFQQQTSADRDKNPTQVNFNDKFDYSLNCSQVADSLKIKPFLLEEGLDLIQKQLIPHP